MGGIVPMFANREHRTNMSIGAWFVVIPTICYAGAACVYAWNREWPLVAVYSGYAFANCGLIVMAK